MSICFTAQRLCFGLLAALGAGESCVCASDILSSGYGSEYLSLEASALKHAESAAGEDKSSTVSLIRELRELWKQIELNSLRMDEGRISVVDVLEDQRVVILSNSRSLPFRPGVVLVSEKGIRMQLIEARKRVAAAVLVSEALGDLGSLKGQAVRLQ